MKRDYIRPQVLVEEFVPNQAIAAACTSATSIVFDCMKGEDTDTAVVISSNEIVTGSKTSSCSVNVGFAPGTTVAINQDPGKDHSSNSDCLSWTYDRSGNLVATATSEIKGFIYICAENRHSNDSANDFHTDCWSAVGNTLTHSGRSDEGECYHHMIAPVVGVVAIGS